MLEKLKFLYRAYRYKYKIDVSEIDFIIKNLQQGDIAVDIGSHKGGYLYWLQKSVGTTGKVYAFEPQIKLHQYLNNAIQNMNYTNVILENKGLSNKTGVVNFHIPLTKSGTSPGAKIDLLKEEGKGSNIAIKVSSLDQYFLANQIIPKLIKIDVEGHEEQVILGGIELLKKHHPTLLIECENRHLKNKNIFEVFDHLLNIGYKGYYFSGKSRQPLEHFKLDIHQKIDKGRFWEAEGYINNFVFIS